MRMEGKVEAMAISLSRGGRRYQEKAMKTLTPKGVFIGSPMGLSDLHLLRAGINLA